MRQFSRVDGDMLRPVAHYGPMPIAAAAKRPIDSWLDTRAEPLSTGERFIFMILRAELETEFPEATLAQQVRASGRCLATPLLREGVPIGAIHDPPHGGSSVHRQADRAS